MRSGTAVTVQFQLSVYSQHIHNFDLIYGRDATGTRVHRRTHVLINKPLLAPFRPSRPFSPFSPRA